MHMPASHPRLPNCMSFRTHNTLLSPMWVPLWLIFFLFPEAIGYLLHKKPIVLWDVFLSHTSVFNPVLLPTGEILTPITCLITSHEPSKSTLPVPNPAWQRGQSLVSLSSHGSWADLGNSPYCLAVESSTHMHLPQEDRHTVVAQQKYEAINK